LFLIPGRDEKTCGEQKQEAQRTIALNTTDFTQQQGNENKVLNHELHLDEDSD